MKLNLKLTSLLLGTCVLAGPSASAMDPRSQHESEKFTSVVNATNADLGRAEVALAAAQAELASAQAEFASAQAEFASAQAAFEAADVIKDAKRKLPYAQAALEAALEAANFTAIRDAEENLQMIQIAHESAKVTKAANAAKERLQAAKDRCKRAASKVQQAERAISEKESLVHIAHSHMGYLKLFKFLKSVYDNGSNVIIITGDSRDVNFWSPNFAERSFNEDPLAMSITPDIGVSSREVINRGVEYDTYRIQLYPLSGRERSKYVDVVIYKDWNFAEDRPRDDAAFSTFLNDMASKYSKLTVLHCDS